VTKIGLLYFYPSRIDQSSVERLSYEADITWVEMEKNEAGFLRFLGEVLSLLESPVLPDSSPSCQWCNYLARVSHGIDM
jgi:hypothetical protein